MTSFLVPGLRFFYEGQLEGRRAHASIHLARRAEEKPDEALGAFYERLLACLRRPETHDGVWRLCACRAAWSGNPTWDNFIAFTWQLGGGGGIGAARSVGGGGELLVVVNFGATRGQCYAGVELDGLDPGVLVLTDLLGDARHERDGRTLASEGLYLDLAAWECNVFDVRRRGP